MHALSSQSFVAVDVVIWLALLSRFIERQISIVWQQESRAFKSEWDFQKNFNARPKIVHVIKVVIMEQNLQAFC